jgi:hypothetical protein
MLFLDADRNSENVTDFVKLIFKYNPGLLEYFLHISDNEIRYKNLSKEIQTNSYT